MKSVQPLPERSTGAFVWLITLVSWMVTAALGIATIFEVRDIVLGLYLRFFDPNAITSMVRTFSTALATWWMFLWTIILIGYIFGSAEYVYRHVGQSRVWWLFAWTFLIEVVIIAVGTLF